MDRDQSTIGATMTLATIAPRQWRKMTLQQWRIWEWAFLGCPARDLPPLTMGGLKALHSRAWNEFLDSPNPLYESFRPTRGEGPR